MVVRIWQIRFTILSGTIHFTMVTGMVGPAFILVLVGGLHIFIPHIVMGGMPPITTLVIPTGDGGIALGDMEPIMVLPGATGLGIQLGMPPIMVLVGSGLVEVEYFRGGGIMQQIRVAVTPGDAVRSQTEINSQVS